ncbi:pectate lyase [Phytophthora cinnamomi]|uniref:pectate lyase n=1 Tax=Phytophthora cinnamomi TaxID=4785 RepID=UPI00355AC442|nr:pectate lyase [Phytophthora cinnamomi]
MVVINFSGATGVTISNSDFDGNTKFSASCDGHHYWGFLILGKKTELSLIGNYIHHTSGRSPKIGGHNGETSVVHAANNYFFENSGHAFDVATGGYVLAEGNYFASVKSPNLDDPRGNFFVPARESFCKTAIGRACKLNVLTDSGKLTGYSARAALGELTKYSKDIGSYVVKEAAQLKEASGNFGVGELTSTTAQSTSTGSAATSDSAPAVEKGDTTNADITQGETVSTESPVGTVAPYSQTADKETPTNEADVATQTEVGADADSNDVTQTTFQSTEARSISKCKVRQRH